MLGGDDNCVHTDRLAIAIGHGDLAFGVRLEFRAFAGMAKLGHTLEDAVRERDRGRHQLIGLVACITEHDALVASAFLGIGAGALIDASGDVFGLAVQPVIELQLLPVEAVLFIADVLDRVADNRLDHVGRNRVWAAHFAEQGNLVGRCSGLTGNANARRVVAGLQRFPEIEVDDFVGDAVANLVWVAFRNTFTGEKKIWIGQNNIRWLE